MWDPAATNVAIAAVHQGGAAPVVRVPLGDFATASRALDFGAEGIIAPMINTAEDARAFVSAAKFPPVGARSWGPHRAAMLVGIAQTPDYLSVANIETVTLAMIETRMALKNLDAIATTDGIDALFVGPYDLSVALAEGAAVNPQSPAVEDALAVILDAAKRAGKIAGIYCADAERAVTYARRGFRFLAVGSDLGFLKAGAAAQLQTLRAAG